MLLLICLQSYAIKRKKTWLNRSKPCLFVSIMCVKADLLKAPKLPVVENDGKPDGAV